MEPCPKHGPHGSSRECARCNEQRVVGAIDGRLLADVALLRWTLDNIYTVARREHRRVEGGKALRPEMWAHVLRLCEKTGAQSRTVGVMREEPQTVDAVDPQGGITTD